MALTFKDFIGAIRKRTWPAGEPRNLKEAHNQFFREAMVEVGRWVKYLHLNNVNVFPACSTYVDCGKTIVDMPDGFINRVYTIANNDWCDRVDYWQATYQELDCKARSIITPSLWLPPTNAGLPALQQGIKFAEPSTDNKPGTDSPYGRARIGVWANWHRRFYLFPWIQSNEQLVIEWDGYKTVWADTDLVDQDIWQIDAEAAIKAFVLFRHEQEFGAPDRARMFKDEFYGDQRKPGGLLGDLMYWGNRKLEQRDAVQPCVEETRMPTSAEVEDDEVPTITEGVSFAIIGDFGDPNHGTAELDVSNLVKGWDDGQGTFFILTTGDNIYSPEDSYADSVSPFYGDYVKSDLPSNRFWPVPGNHDHTDPANGFEDYLAFFHLPNNGRYYDFVKGPVHFFMLHSAVDGVPGNPSPEPDGIDVAGVQANYLRVKLALSTARWKVVIVQDPPFTLHDSDFPGHTILRWPFKDWGAHVVISGDTHAYQRFEVDGLPYIVNGAGGASLKTFDPDNGNVLTAFKKATYNADHGAMKCSATCDELKFEFWNRLGVLIDSLTLNA